MHRTGIPIAAVDINEQSTHAVLAGRDILKTVRVQDRAIVEDLNLRNQVNTYISTQHLKPEEIRKRREFLPAKDVRWSHGNYSHVVATAAQNGRIALYDVTTLGSSRVELAWIYQHVGQVNKLDFDPHQGYMLLSGSQDKYCKIWDIRDQRNPIGYNQYHVKAPVRDVRWSPTNAFDFALCTENGVVQKWDVRNPSRYLVSINAHSKSCYTIAWHPDGKHIASGGVDKLLRIWDMKSELKGQKHVLQLRCPHGIMNLAWRPPSWSAEFAQSGSWQTCHIATSYTDDDPRVHVWDLRRPLLPFRESSHYDTRPLDLLWADKDLLWTVGGAGIFVQTDMSYAYQVEESLPPGAVEWSPDGSFYAVVEDRIAEHRPAVTDPSAAFLNVPQDILSGAEDGTASRSLTDDEGTDASLLDHSRRQNKSTTSRLKPHPNTPPTHDNHPKILPLDRAVLGKKEIFINGQVGAVSRMPGVHVPVPTTEFVANNYARAMTARERTMEPNKILPRLESAFLHNAKVSQAADMMDVACNWTLMAELVVPELKSWADNNRKRRLYEEQQSKIKDEDRKVNDQETLTPFPKLAAKGKGGKSPARSEKAINNLFRGVVGSHRDGSDSGSHGGSNMTTPRQQPLLSSPAASRRDGNMWFTLDDAIEPMQPLPPSLANAHSTAAAASRALLDNNSEPSNSPLSSPERFRLSPERPRGHHRSATEFATASTGSQVAEVDAKPTAQHLPLRHAQVPVMGRNQEDRRAALRDYKVSARQPFSLEAPVISTQYGREKRHDSSESFAMFSVSGSSSARARSFGRSLGGADIAESPSRPGNDSEDWFQRTAYSESIPLSEPDNEREPGRENQDSTGNRTADFAMDEISSLSFGLDGAVESKPVVASDPVTQKFREVLSRSPQTTDEVQEPGSQANNETSVLPTSEEPHGDNAAVGWGLFARSHHLSNPLLREDEGTDKLLSVVQGDPSLSSNYHASDFRPIDITRYEPSTHGFAISTYAVISAAIQDDVNQSSACSQFSAHLLSHTCPFFFHQSFRSQPSPDELACPPTTLADRLMNPMFSSRVIEGIFASHMEYLRSLGLYIPAAELRKICVDDFDFPHLAGPEARTPAAPVGAQLKVDPLKLRWTCSHCHNLLSPDVTVCKICDHRVGECPICELPLTVGPDIAVDHDSEVPTCGNSVVAVYCHVCGHSAHLSCMSAWLSIQDVHGECPTPDCGCDCGPGFLRDMRIARQIEANQEAAIKSRGQAAPSVKRDTKVVGQIPAIDKARDTLRKTPSGIFGGVAGPDRAGDAQEKPNTPSSAGTAGSASAWSKKGTSAAPSRTSVPSLGRSDSGGATSVSAGTSFGRRVRLVEPEK